MGCGGAEPEFTFAESDMLTLMGTLNEEAWLFENGNEQFELSFSLEQSADLEITRRAAQGIMETAQACGDRTFITSASACVDMSYLGLQGAVDITNVATGAVVALSLSLTGSMNVVGLNLSNAQVELIHPQGVFSFVSDTGTHFELQEASW